MIYHENWLSSLGSAVTTHWPASHAFCSQLTIIFSLSFFMATTNHVHRDALNAYTHADPNMYHISYIQTSGIRTYSDSKSRWLTGKKTTPLLYCWKYLLSMTWLLHWILFLHVSTFLGCFCTHIVFLNNVLDKLLWNSFISDERTLRITRKSVPGLATDFLVALGTVDKPPASSKLFIRFMF